MPFSSPSAQRTGGYCKKLSELLTRSGIQLSIEFLLLSLCFNVEVARSVKMPLYLRSNLKYCKSVIRAAKPYCVVVLTEKVETVGLGNANSHGPVSDSKE
jgi:hypothetical protein